MKKLVSTLSILSLLSINEVAAKTGKLKAVKHGITPLVVADCGEWKNYVNRDGQVIGRWRQCDGYTQHQYYKNYQ